MDRTQQKTPPADLVAVRYNDVFVIGIFGDNGYWGKQPGGIRIVQEVLAMLVLHPVQCDELMLWFAFEVGGAHTSSGCYDLFTTVREDQAPRSVFIPQFKVEPTGAPRAMLNLMRANSLLKRLNIEIGEADLNAIAAAERPPTTLNQRVLARAGAGHLLRTAPVAKCFGSRAGPLLAPSAHSVDPDALGAARSSAARRPRPTTAVKSACRGRRARVDADGRLETRWPEAVRFINP